jgi:hypothetical protein
MLGDMKFTTTVLLEGKTATGLVIPDDVVVALGAGKRPKVAVRINGHTYRSTVAAMRGQSLLALSAENRAAAGVAAGDVVEVDLTLDDAPREVVVPDDLSSALGDGPTRAFFDQLSFTHRKEWVRWVTDAKKPETRVSRIEKTVAELAQGKRTH